MDFTDLTYQQLIAAFVHLSVARDDLMRTSVEISVDPSGVVDEYFVEQANLLNPVIDVIREALRNACV